MELGLSNKRALITGGAKGIGKAIAKDLAKEGVKIVLISRNEKMVEETFREIGGKKAGHYAIVGDVTEEDGVRKIGDEVFAHFPGVDIVVNNVGDTLGITDPFCSIADWRKVFRLNLEVHVEVNNLFIPYMMGKKWGRIVNITAGASMENSGPVPYCSIKAAYTAYTRSMGRVLASHNIVMSAVLPGVVLTEDGHWSRVLKERPEHAERYLNERTVLKRFGQPNEISPMVVLLCSNLATFCQGSIVPVDGGQAKHYFQTSEIGT